MTHEIATVSLLALTSRNITADRTFTVVVMHAICRRLFHFFDGMKRWHWWHKKRLSSSTQSTLNKPEWREDLQGAATEVRQGKSKISTRPQALSYARDLAGLKHNHSPSSIAPCGCVIVCRDAFRGKVMVAEEPASAFRQLRSDGRVWNKVWNGSF